MLRARKFRNVTNDLPEQQTDSRYDLRILGSLRRIIRSVELYSKKLSSQFSITGPQLVCLLAIGGHDKVTASIIAKEIHLSPSTVVGVLDRLEEKQLIERTRDRTDRRKVYICLTDKGRALAESAPSPLQDRLSSSLGDLEESEKSTIALALERVVGLMEVEDLDIIE